MSLYPQLDPVRPAQRGPRVDWRALARHWLRRLAKAVFVVAILTVVWRFFYPIYSWRQKIEVTVSTPQGKVSGSSVMAVTWGDSPDILPDPPHVYHYSSGEAVVVELPGNGHLFALMTDLDSLALRVFGKDKFPKQTPYAADSLLPAAAEVNGHFGETLSLTPDQYPLLVTFGDLNDPASVRRVDPQNLAASFGAGYRLEGISITITYEPVTEGKVEAVLGWLDEYYDIHLDGQRIETVTAKNRLANSLAAGSFDTDRN
jgi:hypothetical protein